MRRFSILTFICISLLSCDSLQQDCVKLSQENEGLISKIDSLEQINAVLEDKLKGYLIKGEKKKGPKVAVAKQKNDFITKENSDISLQSFSSNNKTSVKSSPATSYSGQCGATTKKGYRCSRKSRSGGYCWQHGG